MVRCLRAVGFLLRLVLEFAVIENFADWRGGVRRDLDQIQANALSALQCLRQGHDPHHFAVLVDQTNFLTFDVFVDAMVFSRSCHSGRGIPFLLQHPRARTAPPEDYARSPTTASSGEIGRSHLATN